MDETLLFKLREKKKKIAFVELNIIFCNTFLVIRTSFFEFFLRTDVCLRQLSDDKKNVT